MIRFSERRPRKWLWSVRRWALASAAIILFSPSSIDFARSLSWTAASPQQDSRIATAQQTFAEGQQLLAEATAVSQRKAIDKFAEAAVLWHALADKRQEAIALSLIGKAYDLMDEKE